MLTGFVNANIDKSGKKNYSYHGMERDCDIQPDPDPEDYFISKYGPFPVYEKELRITTIYQCGETHWAQNLFAPLGYLTCDPNFVRHDDMQSLYTKTRWWVGNGQALYNKESLLDKLKHKVVAIQSITVYMKGQVYVDVPGTHYNCGPGYGKLYVACSYTVNSWPGVCTLPGSKKTWVYRWKKCKPIYLNERNWDMAHLEELAKIGFRVDPCTEDDPDDYGINRTRGYVVYCIVKYKKSLVVSLGFQDLEWDIGSFYAVLYGKILGCGGGCLMAGFQVWKKETPGNVIEKMNLRAPSEDDYDIWKVFNYLEPETEYKYRAVLRNTGVQGDTLVGVTKGFITKSL